MIPRLARLRAGGNPASILGSMSEDKFFATMLQEGEGTMLQEGEGKHRHERMAVKTLPGSPFEVVEAKFLFHLLMRLLANPPCLDGNGQSRSVAAGRLAR